MRQTVKLFRTLTVVSFVLLLLICPVVSHAAEVTGTSAGGESVKVSVDFWSLFMTLITSGGDKFAIIGGIITLLYNQWKQNKSGTVMPADGTTPANVLPSGSSGAGGFLNIGDFLSLGSMIQTIVKKGVPEVVDINAQYTNEQPLVFHFSRVAATSQTTTP